MVGAGDGLDRLAVLEEEKQLLLDERRVDGGVARDDVGRERRAVPVAAEDEPFAHAVGELLALLVQVQRVVRLLLIAPLGLGPLAQAVPPPLARVQRLLVDRVGVRVRVRVRGRLGGKG